MSENRNCGAKGLSISLTHQHVNTPLLSNLDAWGKPCGGVCSPHLLEVSCHYRVVVKAFASGQWGPGSIPGRSRSCSDPNNPPNRFQYSVSKWKTNNVHCPLYTVHCPLFSVHCPLYSVHCPLYSIHCCSLYTVYVHSPLYSVHCPLYTLYTAHCTVYTAHCTVYTAAHCIQCTYTAHCIHCTLPIVQCTGSAVFN